MSPPPPPEATSTWQMQAIILHTTMLHTCLPSTVYRYYGMLTPVLQLLLHCSGLSCIGPMSDILSAPRLRRDALLPLTRGSNLGCEGLVYVSTKRFHCGISSVSTG